jgi:hypothetical protein
MRHPFNIPCEDEKYFVDYIDFREANDNKNLSTALSVVSRSIYSIQARENIARLLDRAKPDVAHLQNIHGHITPSIIFELSARSIPMFWTLHDYKLICPNTHLLSHGHICELCKGSAFYQCLLNRCKKDSYSASLVATVEAYAHRVMHFRDNIDGFISPSNFLRTKFLEFGWPRAW